MVLMDLFEHNPVIGAVKNEEGLEKCLKSDCQIVFVLYGNLMTIQSITEKVKSSGKRVLVHLDLIDGLSSKEVAVDFIRQSTSADGIISTKANLLKKAKSAGLVTVQRVFVLDSLALLNISRQLALDWVDAVEILPGVMPKILAILAKEISKPIIAGGLISDKEDVLQAINAGASAISSSNEKVWFM